jgi:flagellar basal-body rod protein FlgC
MIQALDISTSGLVAQRTRLNAITGNIANVSTTRNEMGETVPYQSRTVVFEVDENTATSDGGIGVRVASVETEDKEPLWRYQPGHPDAQTAGDKKGYVAYPNINVINEFVDATEATRAYEANLGVIEVTKSLSAQTLRIIA